MKIKKGKFNICAADGWLVKEGSYAKNYPFIIHRSEGEFGWHLSHLATGYSIRKNLSLKHARWLAKELKQFSIFLVPTIDTWKHQIEVMENKRPSEKELLLSYINGDYNEKSNKN